MVGVQYQHAAGWLGGGQRMVGSLTRSNMTLGLVGQCRRRRASGLTVAALSLGEGQSDSCCS
jgi:hypothetical protein